MPSISFSVSYGLREYLSIFRDHLPAMLEMQVAAGLMKRRPSKLWYPLLLVASTGVFFVKKHRVGDCDFVIDGKGIRRTARDGTMMVPWNDLIAVPRYSRAFLFDKGLEGAMPLPYRCFSPEQRVAMEGFIQAFEVQGQKALVAGPSGPRPVPRAP
ncbi:MAG: YcxB family protein [Usitatibacter sp.]